ncbi:hypothetical protein AVEN_270982-1, partial [Araneus ventricosus]
MEAYAGAPSPRPRRRNPAVLSSIISVSFFFLSREPFLPPTTKPIPENHPHTPWNK